MEKPRLHLQGFWWLTQQTVRVASNESFPILSWTLITPPLDPATSWHQPVDWIPKPTLSLLPTLDELNDKKGMGRI